MKTTPRKVGSKNGHHNKRREYIQWEVEREQRRAAVKTYTQEEIEALERAMGLRP